MVADVEISSSKPARHAQHHVLIHPSTVPPLTLIFDPKIERKLEQDHVLAAKK